MASRGTNNGVMREGVSTAGVHSTTATSDDDVTHYHAYTQTSDSDQRSSKFKLTGLTRSRRNNGRGPAHRKAGRSFDPSAKDVLEGGAGFRPPYQSSSDLSSPNNETCYSFVRRALQVNYIQCFLLFYNDNFLQTATFF